MDHDSTKQQIAIASFDANLAHSHFKRHAAGLLVFVFDISLQSVLQFRV